jgi:vacuolar-type H+-ATPase subunit I/STV1
MSPRTIYLSRLLGLYYLFITVAMITRKEETIEWVTEIVRSPAASFTAGLIGVAIGLAIVLAHNVWRGGALAVVVTLLGWIGLIKSLLFLYLTPQMEAEIFLKRLHYQQFFYFYMTISLVIGVYLTYGGFASSRRS